MVPLLTRIDRELKVCNDPLARAELLAERACYLARIGEFAEANEIAGTLRITHGNGRNGRVSVWIMLIEGLILFFDKLSMSARDRIVRANALSASMQMSHLHALTSAWLAHIEFERRDYDSMLILISNCLTKDVERHHDVQSRINMVLGDAHLYLGEKEKSQKCYRRAHYHAIENGDQATIGALMYNRAAFGLASICASISLKRCPVDTDILLRIEMELDSALNFQIGTGVHALSYLIDVCRVQILMLRDQWIPAMRVLERLQTEMDWAKNQHTGPVLLVHLIWCFLNSERHKDAVNLLDKFDIEVGAKLDCDDQLVLLSTLIKINTFLSREDDVNALEIRFHEIEKKYSKEIEILRGSLDGIA